MDKDGGIMSYAGLEITLRPLKGMADIPGLGSVEITHDQLMVYAGSRQIEMGYGVSPVHVGYADPNSTTVEFLAHIRPWPKEALEYVCAEVERLTGKPREGRVPASVLRAPDTVELDDGDLE
jgi:hypothetical protein